jgi:hypothetical protein
MMHQIWEKLTAKVWDEAMQVGVEIGYQAGIQAAVNLIDAMIAGGYAEDEGILEKIIEELQGYDVKDE